MKNDKKIRKQPIIKETERIHSIKSLPDNLMRFSFRHFYENDKFSINLSKDGYVGILIRRLRDISQLTLSEFRSNKGQSLRAHQIQPDTARLP